MEKRNRGRPPKANRKPIIKKSYAIYEDTPELINKVKEKTNLKTNAEIIQLALRALLLELE